MEDGAQQMKDELDEALWKLHLQREKLGLQSHNLFLELRVIQLKQKEIKKVEKDLIEKQNQFIIITEWHKTNLAASVLSPGLLRSKETLAEVADGMIESLAASQDEIDFTFYSNHMQSQLVALQEEQIESKKQTLREEENTLDQMLRRLKLIRKRSQYSLDAHIIVRSILEQLK